MQHLRAQESGAKLQGPVRGLLMCMDVRDRNAAEMVKHRLQRRHWAGGSGGELSFLAPLLSDSFHSELNSFATSALVTFPRNQPFGTCHNILSYSKLIFWYSDTFLRNPAAGCYRSSVKSSLPK